MKKKINIYRSNFRKEAKKVEDSMRSGSGTDDVYTPTWTYYEDLVFLKDQEAIRSSTSNLEAHEVRKTLFVIYLLNKKVTFSKIQMVHNTTSLLIEVIWPHIVSHS